VTTDQVTLLCPFFVVLWLCCDVLHLIVLLKSVLFCIIHFHIKRHGVVLCFGVCSAPSCDMLISRGHRHRMEEVDTHGSTELDLQYYIKKAVNLLMPMENH